MQTPAGRRRVPPVRQCAGRPRKRPAKLHADKGYDYDHCRRACRRQGIVPRIAKREPDGGRRQAVEREIEEVGLTSQAPGDEADADPLAAGSPGLLLEPGPVAVTAADEAQAAGPAHRCRQSSAADEPHGRQQHGRPDAEKVR